MTDSSVETPIAPDFLRQMVGHIDYQSDPDYKRQNALLRLYHGFVEVNADIAWSILFSSITNKQWLAIGRVGQEIFRGHTREYEFRLEPLRSQESIRYKHSCFCLMAELRDSRDSVAREMIGELSRPGKNDLATAMQGSYVNVGLQQNRSYTCMAEACRRFLDIQTLGEWGRWDGDHERFAQMAKPSILKLNYLRFIKKTIEICLAVDKYSPVTRYGPSSREIDLLVDIEPTDEELEKLSRSPSAILYCSALAGKGGVNV